MRRAFTLIEIMIVVAILLVLATIAIGGMSRCYDTAIARRCVSNLRVVHAAREAYFFQNPSDTVCLLLKEMATAGYFRGRTDTGGGYPKCPGGGENTYTYPTFRSDLQTMPTCPYFSASHTLTLYE